MNLNKNKWQEFIVSQYFSVELANGDLKIADCEPGDIPLISSGKTNNGIIGYIKENGDGISTIFSENKITVDMFCNAFYQPCSFFAVSHGRVNILTPKFNMNASIGLFITTIINKEQSKFSYGRAVYSDEIARMVIRLPSVKHNDSLEPDWNFMEQYIKSLHYKPIITSNKRRSLQSFNINSWKEFSLTSIFTKIETGKAHDNMLDDGDDCIYLGAKKDDNCVMRRCAANPDLMHAGNGIVFICNGQGSVGYTNYIDRPFIATTDLKIGYFNKLNKYNALFLVAVLDKERQKYSFGRKWGPHLKETKIKLPAKLLKNGKYAPDWYYMESYIKSLPYGDKI